MERHAKKMQAKSRKVEVVETATPGVFEAHSPSGETYLVTAQQCGCKWAAYHPDKVCSHRLAVLNHQEKGRGRRLSFWNAEQDAERQHRPTTVAGDVWATSRLWAVA